jgi:cation transport ATPase
MDVEKLEQEVKNILVRADSSRNYAEIRQELQQKGYSQKELRYMMALVDQRLLSSLEKGGQSKSSKRNIILGAALSLMGLAVVLASYFGQQLPKEATYVALVVFAIGYLVFRHGYRNRGSDL